MRVSGKYDGNENDDDDDEYDSTKYDSASVSRNLQNHQKKTKFILKILVL